ncbi:putative RNA-directed DNA polymerase [Helianthus annuus]|nr:putative RNA-directed DNA polymerase [Helianthus annuus]
METRPAIFCHNVASLSEAEADILVEPFSALEIKRAVWDCVGDRAPGPDGFNFKFIKKNWDLFHSDFLRIFQEFYAKGSINKCCSSSFLALIPKVKDPSSPSDFRPISLIGVINKAISKVLVNRLKKVIGNLISEEQSAFLAGRNITYGPLILNETIAWLKKTKKPGMIFKVDINKAYDSVNWKFLDSVMMQMSFPDRWRKWIMATLVSARASVIVNGSPTMEFECTRGLRQGDPLSPFLFVIAMEALTGIMKKAMVEGIFNGLKCTRNGPILSHLIYADDVVFLGRWSHDNAQNLRRILRCFYLASGLKVNLSKCIMFGVGVQDVEVQEMAEIMHCKKGSFPVKHLGLVVGANMNLIHNWKPVIDIFRNRLSLWKAKNLSYGGRITLLKLVLNSLPTYFFSLYKAPVTVLDTLERIRRAFFWGGSDDNSYMSWMAWEKVIAPLEYGGLGFGSLRDANLAMLSKWWWRFKTDKEGLWRRVVWAIHHNTRSWSSIPAKVSIAGPWKQTVGIKEQLIQVGLNLSDLIWCNVGTDSKAIFWLDFWIGNQPLYCAFPLLFAMEKVKLCRVSDRVSWGPNGVSFSWDWKSPFMSDDVADEFQNLTELLSHFSVRDGTDDWIWKLQPYVGFSVASIKNVAAIFNRTIPDYLFMWNNSVPKKVGVVSWRAIMERLPTRAALAARNIVVGDTGCPFCNEYAETSDHLFVSCQFTQVVWLVIAQWCKLPPFIAFSLKDVLDLHVTVNGSKRRKKMIYAIIQVVIWSIWRLRNEVVFNNGNPSVAKVVEESKSMSYLWIKNRMRSSLWTWNEWRNFSIVL